MCLKTVPVHAYTLNIWRKRTNINTLRYEPAPEWRTVTPSDESAASKHIDYHKQGQERAMRPEGEALPTDTERADQDAKN